MPRPFRQVDVFGSKPLCGNPLAVVLDAEGLSGEVMQRLARWTNLSETAYVMPPTSPHADYRVRIFTLARELPFAGHPTLGACHAWLEAGGRPQRPDVVVQECGVGLVEVRRGADGLAFAAPPLVRTGAVDEATAERVALVLGVEPGEIEAMEWVDNGPGWIGVLLSDAESVLTLEPDFERSPGEPLFVGVAGPYPEGSECAFEVRALLADDTGALLEDPVTGSLNAALAQWLLGSGRAQAPYVVSQGTRVGRRGRPRIEQDGEGTVWVGGDTVTYISGEIAL